MLVFFVVVLSFLSFGEGVRLGVVFSLFKTHCAFALITFSEHCLEATGPTVFEMGALLVKHGVVEAINLDGGGSTSFVKDYGVVQDHPTCDDTYKKCERTVSTILCVRY